VWHVEAELLKYRVVLTLIATLVLFVLVVLPFSVASMVDDLFASPDGRVFRISEVPPGGPAATHSNLHVTVATLDEVQRLVTLRVSGHHICRPACDWSDRVTLFALAENPGETEGLPPSGSVSMPPTAVDVTHTFQLPIRGNPIRYPFDAYWIRLGIVHQRVYPDGTLYTLTPRDEPGHMFMTIQEQLSRQWMSPPAPLDPQGVQGPEDPYEYLQVFDLSFARPLYLQVLSVVLVLLAAAAAAYAVFMGPFHDLFINSGALVLGVWGIRSILTPQNMYFVTAIDIALSVVVVFLLGAISVHALLIFHKRSGLRNTSPAAGKQAP